MNNPELYVKVDHVQRIGAQVALQEFGDTINWRCDGRDSILDAGCGPGDVSYDILMPVDFKRYIGVDISKEMIAYARKTYAHPKLSFELFDLSKDLEKQPFRNVKPFDHIFSFNVLLWVLNLETCIRNFYKLLVPNGDMLLLTPAYDAYKEFFSDKRWAKYKINIDDKKLPFQDSQYFYKHPCDMLSRYGFSDCEVKMYTTNTTFKNVDSLREFLQVMTPFQDQLPIEERAPFIELIVQETIKGCTRPNGHGDQDEIILPTSYVVVYAKKKGIKNCY